MIAKTTSQNVYKLQPMCEISYDEPLLFGRNEYSILNYSDRMERTTPTLTIPYKSAA